MPKGTIVTDTFSRTITGPLGSTDTGQAYASFSAGPGTNTPASSSGALTVSMTGTAAFYAGYLPAVSEPDVDIAITSVVGAATGGPLEFLNLLTRGTSLTSYYLGRVQIETSGILTAHLFAPNGTEIDSVAVPIPPPPPGIRVRMRMQSIGRYHRLKVWLPDTQDQPPHWLLSTVDDGYTGAGWVGWRVGIAGGNTNAKPYTFTLDDFTSVQVPDYTTDNVPVQLLWAPGANLADDYRTWPWQDITTRQRQASPTTVKIGRGDEASVTQPASCQLSLNNPDLKFSAYHPASPNYPNVNKNTPFWLLVNGVTRFFGYANGFPQSTLDVSGKIPVVSVQASGSLRRLIQGRNKGLLRSPLTRSVLSDGASYPLYQYWPCEDGQGSTRIGSALPGGQPMAQTGALMAAIDPNTLPDGTNRPGWVAAGLPRLGTSPVPDLSRGGQISASFPASNASEWTVQFGLWRTVDEDVAFTFDRQCVEWYTPGGTYVRWRVVVVNTNQPDDAGLYVYAFKQDGTSSKAAIVGFGATGWTDFTVSAKQNGTSISVTFDFAGQRQGSATFASATLAGVTGVLGNPTATDTSDDGFTFSIAQVRIWNTATPPIYQSFSSFTTAWFSWVDEPATDRIRRLCAEQRVPIDIVGTSTAPMGAQSVDTFVNLLRECEAADLGLLYDGLGPGLGYIARAARYNETAFLTLDAAQGEIAPPFTPTDDDQRTINLAKVSRTDGASATYEVVDGPMGTDTIGEYENERTLNLSIDDPLPGYSRWIAHQGTVEGFRYPNLGIDLRSRPGLSSAWLDTVLNGRVDAVNVTDATAQHPPGDVLLLLEGYAETIGTKVWKVAATTSPFQPWIVAQMDVNWRLEAAGQTLAADLAPGATTLSLATAAGHAPFTTTARYPGDFSMDLNVAGWQVHVLNGYGKWLNSNPFFESTASPWTALNGTVARSTVHAHSGSGALLLTPNGVAASCEARTENIPATVGASYIAQAWVFCVVARNVSINLIWRDSGGTLLSSSSSSVNVAANTWTVLTVTATAPPSTTQVQGSVSMGSTPPVSNLLYIDQGMVIDPAGPQVLTVEASPNTITVPAGATVKLWRPPVLAL